MPELESSLESFFHQRVRLLGGRAFKFAPIVKGNPDRIVLMPGGHIYFVELKREGETTDPAQKVWHDRAAELGTRVYVLAGRAAVVAWLREVWLVSNPESELELI